MQKAHRRGRACKLLRLLQVRIAPRTEICATLGLLYRGIMFTPIQGAYEKEAKGMESLKMTSFGWCKRRTDEYGPANCSVCSNSAWRREWKFAQILGYLYSGTMVAPTQGAYEKEAKGMDSLKM